MGSRREVGAPEREEFQFQQRTNGTKLSEISRSNLRLQRRIRLATPEESHLMTVPSKVPWASAAQSCRNL